MATAVLDRITTVDVSNFEHSVFFSIVVRGLSFSKQVKDHTKLLAYLQQKAQEIEARKAAGGEVNDNSGIVIPPEIINALKSEGSPKAKRKGITISKPLLSSKALDELQGHLTETKAAIVAPPQYGGLANPSGIMDGLFELSKELASTVSGKVDDARAKLMSDFDTVDDKGNTVTRPGYLAAFLADYNAAIERAKSLPILDGGLGPLFNAGDYPTYDRVASSFGIELRWLSLGIPEGLPEELRARAEAELKADLREAAETIKEGMRAGFLALLEHARDVLTIQPGEKPKIIKESLIGNVTQFCETFTLRNTQGDSDLAALVAQCQEALIGVDPAKLRKDVSARDQAAKIFSQISASVDEMITTKKSRVIDLGE
jgi:hypothetical protein